MKRKAKILLISYVSVLVVALALYAWAGQWGLGWYRRTVGESASLAYEETVRSVETLSQVLAKSPYATDPEMCDRICCEAYACAAAAESAMSTLPFSTWELEQLSGFLNTAGDYAYSLCGQGQAFTDKQRQELRELAASAAEFSETLLTLREDLENRDEVIRMACDLLKNLCRFQSEDGRWYQVVDKVNEPGNWLENSCSSLYVAGLCKAMRKGYLPDDYAEHAIRGYEGVIRSLTWEGEDLQIGNVCIGTGVGDYAFYIARPVSVNDLHAVGSFLIMCTEMYRWQKSRG